MIDYQKLYHILFNGITDTIEQLQQLQQQAEELYLSFEDSDESDEILDEHP